MQDAALYDKAYDDLVTFSILANVGWKPNWHHRILAEKLMAVERGEIKRLIITMPPRHGKSQLSTINFPAWYLGRNPDKEIITASYSEDLAVDFGSKTRQLLETEVYKKIFISRLAANDQSKRKWNISFRKGSYTSVGVGGAVTGRGANVFITDDPIKNRKEAESLTYRDSVYDWYKSVARTRLEKNGAIILILTRWHMDDLAGRLLAKAEEDSKASQWEVLNFPAIATEDEPFRKEGEALWPDKYDLNSLMETKADLGGYEWHALFQQNPIASENQKFRQEWWRYKEMSEVDAIATRNFLTVDTAMSRSAKSDYSGFTINYVDRDNNWHLRSFKMRVSPTDLINILFSLHDENGFEKIGIEKTVYSDVLQYLLTEEMKRRGRYLPIVELLHGEVAKEVRIEGLIPRYERHAIYHIKGQCKDLEEEQITFPNGVHDDTLDSAAYQIQIAEPPAGVAYEQKINSNRVTYGYARNK